jgi:hypothetical protein
MRLASEEFLLDCSIVDGSLEAGSFDWFSRVVRIQRTGRRCNSIEAFQTIYNGK